jgi:hypothetical protein
MVDACKYKGMLDALREAGDKLISDNQSLMECGWQEFVIGDNVYFGRNTENGYSLDKGVVIGIARHERRMWQNPNKRGRNKYDYDICKYSILTVETANGKFEIDSTYVYKEKTDAVLVLINNILHNYESVR